MANRRNNQANAQNNSSTAKDASRLTLACLRKRGVELTSHELHLAVLYSRMNSLSWAVLKGSMSPDEATVEADKAYSDFVKLETPVQDSIVAF